MSSFPDLEPVCCSMSSSNCCFLIAVQVSQEAGKVVWYSHLLKNFPQFVVIHTVKGFSLVNEREVYVFLAFSVIQQMLAIWSLVPLPFLNPAYTSGSSRFTYCQSLAWKILSITLLVCEKRLQMCSNLNICSLGSPLWNIWNHQSLLLVKPTAAPSVQKQSSL